jgi:HAE1 family hydrophobic/amphiphilic exporter-1
VSKFDNDQTPVLTLAVSGDRPQRELTEIADKLVKPRSNAAPGVGEVRIVGGPSARSTSGSTPTARGLRPAGVGVRDALARAERDVPGGNVTGDGRARAHLRTLGRCEIPRRSTSSSSRRVDGVPIRVRDVGDARGRHRRSVRSRRARRRADGVLEIRRQSGANTVEPSSTASSGASTTRARSCRRTCGSRSSATSRATSTPRCTRSTCTWCSAAILASLVVLRSCAAGARR